MQPFIGSLHQGLLWSAQPVQPYRAALHTPAKPCRRLGKLRQALGSKHRGNLCLLSQVKASWGKGVPKKKWPREKEPRTASGFPQVSEEDTK